MKMIRLQNEILEKIEMRLLAKVNNNKNCGEQFDRTVIERREIFMQTV